MKKESHNPVEPIEKQHYKKRYLVRKIEEQEAEKEVKQYENGRRAEPPMEDTGWERSP